MNYGCRKGITWLDLIVQIFWQQPVGYYRYAETRKEFRVAISTSVSPVMKMDGKKQKPDAGSQRRRARVYGYLPSRFPLDTHAAQLILADVLDQIVGTSHGEQDQNADCGSDYNHRILLSLN